MISFIVSAYDCPDDLNACLATLAVQQSPKEIIVCANHTDADMLIACGLICDGYGAIMKRTGMAGAKTCYESAEMAVREARGDWLCFPSDDSLYVRDFSRIMLQTATLTGSDLVYCDCVYYRPGWPPYTVLEVKPKMGRIDKTCFILKREWFNGFPKHSKDWRDGALIEQLMEQRVNHAKAPGVLCIHQ